MGKKNYKNSKEKYDLKNTNKKANNIKSGLGLKYWEVTSQSIKSKLLIIYKNNNNFLKKGKSLENKKSNIDNKLHNQFSQKKNKKIVIIKKKITSNINSSH